MECHEKYQIHHDITLITHQQSTGLLNFGFRVFEKKTTKHTKEIFSIKNFSTYRNEKQ
jgi:hypothetical protein